MYQHTFTARRSPRWHRATGRSIALSHRSRRGRRIHNDGTLGALPKWLTPPQAVRALLRGVAGAIAKGTTVSIPTPTGTQVFNVADPAEVERLKATLRGIRVAVAPPSPGVTPTSTPAAGSTPSWLIPAAIGGAALLVVLLGRGSRG